MRTRYSSEMGITVPDGVRGRGYGFDHFVGNLNKLALTNWEHGEETLGSVETSAPALDKYDIATFAADDPKRFLELVNYLSPRDQEIMLCFGVLGKRPTDLSTLFGKAGHRAEEDLHKAAHKLAGLMAFGVSPAIAALTAILQRQGVHLFGHHDFAACLWEYANRRDFCELARLVGTSGLRHHMLRVFKRLHASEGREEGLLAGWILWLVDGSDPRGKGWRKRRRGAREHKLGPTVFRTLDSSVENCEESRRATQRGGRGQRTKNVKITRTIKFLLRGAGCTA